MQNSGDPSRSIFPPIVSPHLSREYRSKKKFPESSSVIVRRIKFCKFYRLGKNEKETQIRNEIAFSFSRIPLTPA